MTPAQLATELQRRAANLPKSLAMAESELAKAVLRVADEATAEGVSSAQLAQEGHPYSKRVNQPPAPAGVANEQTGRLRHGWRLRVGQWQGGNLTITLYNVAPEARWFDDKLAPNGTKWMIARPMQAWIVTELKKQKLSALVRTHLQI